MKTGGIILCRYDSKRLPGKILKLINGKPILQYIYERLSLVHGLDILVVATSVEASDNPIASYCHDHHFECYRGSKDNVAQRFLDCANSYQMDYAVRINGDNLFTDPVILDQMLHIAENGKYDFISNVKGRTFPRGMSIEIVRTAFYNEALTRFSTPEHFEHVTSYLYEHDDFGKQFHFINEVEPEAAGINMAIDTPEDFSSAEKMISRMNKDHREYNLRELFALWKEAKNEISVGG